jgi:hypothetical protein
MEKRILLAVSLGCAFFLGLLVSWTMIHGMRKGEIRIRNQWWNRGEDGWMFWVAGSTYAIAGIGMMVGAIVLAIQWLGN